ncbi:PTS transporter subunit EIIB [Streptomyces sp. Go-475]|uniref:PTS transporter subunit EIIB n=1 Tax=Streptomyces sp. Go-475 TaxID=2072505 RepID=UPI000DF0B401|nr:PTS transporter subunit EIIB [Streptomyces sp. Go-475]AXE86595.1 PTS system beta-glucoside-specific transporter subunits IIABC [Streptomyces sp. Go-475]
MSTSSGDHAADATQDGDHAADAILRGVGGRENVTRLTHCFVRLRFRLRDPAAADLDALATHPLVAFTVWQADELHIAPRRDLFRLFEDVRNALGDIAAP